MFTREKKTSAPKVTCSLKGHAWSVTSQWLGAAQGTLLQGASTACEVLGTDMARPEVTLHHVTSLPLVLLS